MADLGSDTGWAAVTIPDMRNIGSDKSQGSSIRRLSSLCTITTNRSVLGTSIDTTILRGVPVSVVLARVGQAFRDRTFTQADYERSQRAWHLDDFISHDWHSGWFGKTLALCLIYNSRAAAFTSLTFGVLLSILQWELGAKMLARKPSPGHTEGPRLAIGYWCGVACPLVFLVVFFFWQDFRTMLRLRPRLVFMDKYCIDQEDPERKEAGILGLGGFLKHTKRLVVCWTPKYFTRLWCTYEVACWVHLSRAMGEVEFMPVSHAISVVSLTLSCSVMSNSYALFSALIPLGQISTLVHGLAAIAVFLVAMHAMRRQTHEIRQLPVQLQEFSIKHAACFCCAQKHRVPGSPEGEEATLPCDRKLVCKTVRVWFDGADTDHFNLGDSVDNTATITTANDNKSESSARVRQSPSGLAKFDELVRHELGTQMLECAGPTTLPYKYVVVCGLGFAFRALDVFGAMGAGSSDADVYSLLLEFPTVVIAGLPLCYKTGLYLTSWTDEVVGIPSNIFVDFLVTFACTGAILLLLLVSWAPIAFLNRQRQFVPSTALALVDYCLTLCMFRDDVRLVLRNLLCGRSKPPIATCQANEAKEMDPEELN